MKSRHLALPIVPFLFCVAAFSQADPSKPAPAASQQSFEKLKALAGSWVGTYEGKPEDVSLRVTSSGNALMHEATQVGVEADPITFFYLEEDRLLLTHYCDAGNRPRMVGKVSPDGKTIEFELLEVADLKKDQFGHMQRVVFTLIDHDHHLEDWIFKVNGDPKLVDAHYDLHRK